MSRSPPNASSPSERPQQLRRAAIAPRRGDVRFPLEEAISSEPVSVPW
jgi:hypothetical protein